MILILQHQMDIAMIGVSFKLMHQFKLLKIKSMPDVANKDDIRQISSFKKQSYIGNNTSFYVMTYKIESKKKCM